jgi:hypothetical protein
MLPDVMGSDHCPLKLTLDLTKGAAPTAEDKPTKM